MNEKQIEGEDTVLAPDPQQVREIQEFFLDRQKPIVFIGPMAAGKSYIAMHLAKFYGYPYLDADQLLVEKYGPVPKIFEEHGEAYFRQKEHEVIKEILESPQYRNTIFSLGGGAPMTPAVAELLADHNIIYVLVDAETVAPRIIGNKTRPLLQPDPISKWNEMFEKRHATYEKLAKYTLDARGGRSILDMTAELQDYILNARKGS